MKRTLLTAAVAVTATLLSTVSVSGIARRSADAATATTWDLNAYGPSSSDNVVLKWNQQLLDTITANAPRTGPTITSRALGVVQTAVYDAWAAYDGVAKRTQASTVTRQPAAARTPENKSKAISFAAYTALNDLFPNETYGRKAKYDEQMTALYGAGFASDTSTPATIGRTAAQAVLAYRHNDGSNQLTGYNDTTGYTPKNTWDKINDPWHWQPLCVPLPDAGATTCPGAVQKPLHPQWGNVKPFGALLPSQYQVTGPPKNANGTYSTADVETALQDTANLDDTKKAQAEYWADGPGSVFPPGHDMIFAGAFCRRMNNSLDTDVKFLFTLGNAMMDAGYAAWYQKYKYDFVRPITAIRAQKKDQLVNSWLGPDKGYGMVKGQDWRPYQATNVVTPAFPEYVSGHSTFSGAGATILAQFTGSDAFNASVTIPAGISKIEANTPKTAVTLTWPTFSAAANEAGWSRRYGGIHFYTGDQHGRALGRQVALYTWAKAQDYFAGRTGS